MKLKSHKAQSEDVDIIMQIIEAEQHLKDFRKIEIRDRIMDGSRMKSDEDKEAF